MKSIRKKERKTERKNRENAIKEEEEEEEEGEEGEEEIGVEWRRLAGRSHVMRFLPVYWSKCNNHNGTQLEGQVPFAATQSN